MVGDLLLALAASAAGCWVVTKLAPPPRHDSLEAFFSGRVVRVLGRIVVVLAVVAVAIGALDRSPVAVTIGALAGWLALALGELRTPRRGGDGG